MVSVQQMKPYYQLTISWENIIEDISVFMFSNLSCNVSNTGHLQHTHTLSHWQTSPHTLKCSRTLTNSLWLCGTLLRAQNSPTNMKLQRSYESVRVCRVLYTHKHTHQCCLYYLLQEGSLQLQLRVRSLYLLPQKWRDETERRIRRRVEEVIKPDQLA